MEQLLEKGYLYMAVGAEVYFKEAFVSANSIKKLDKNAHITLLTDSKAKEFISKYESAFTNVVHIDNEELKPYSGWKYGILFKVMNLYSYSPYKKTIFIDTDTYFIDSPEELFLHLDHFDICMTHSPADRNNIKVGNSVLPAYYAYNTGLILFNKTEVIERMFKDWCKIYEAGEFRGEQPPFMQAYVKENIKTYILTNNWNARTVFYESMGGKVKMVHGRHKSMQKVAEEINATHTGRVWLPGIEKCIHDQIKISKLVVVLIQLFFYFLKKNIKHRFSGKKSKA